jgi:alkylhydroperoxidase family enzyme
MPGATIKALRNGTLPEDAKTVALVKLTRTIVKQRGWIDETTLNEFVAAGYTRAQLLEVLVIVALKTISNYTNHLAKTPLDDAFAGQKWTRPN